MFGPCNAATSDPLPNAPKVTNQQHSQNNSFSSQRQLALSVVSTGEVNISNAAAEIGKESAIRSASPAVDKVSTWSGPNRISGAIRKTPCAIKNSKSACIS